jgi:hypothetical protein
MPFKTFNDAIGASFQHLEDYESPAEEMFGERIRAALAPRAMLTHQVWVATIAGNFRLDMQLTTPHGRRVAIEVDGRDYHDGKRDFWRSILILGVGAVDTVYRATAVDLHRDLAGVLSSLATHEPACFGPASAQQWSDSATVSFVYDDSSDDGDDHQDSDSDDDSEDDAYPSERWSHRPFPGGVSSIRLDSPGYTYRPYLEFAQSSGAKDVDALITLWDGRPEAARWT